MRRLVIHNRLARDSRQEFDEALTKARRIDPLHYLDGLKKLTFVNDIDNHWNASYDFNSDEITVAGKFHDKTFDDKVQTLLHEGGHRGQSVDTPTWQAFRKQGLAQLPFFLAMANQVHQQDYKKNGIDPKDMADEVFAESYARYATGMDLPVPLLTFWVRRAP